MRGLRLLLYLKEQPEEKEGLIKVTDFKEIKVWGDSPQKLRTKWAEILEEVRLRVS